MWETVSQSLRDRLTQIQIEMSRHLANYYAVEYADYVSGDLRASVVGKAPWRAYLMTAAAREMTRWSE